MNKGRGRVVWNDANRDHILLDHPERGLNVTEINEVLTDPRRVEVDDPPARDYRDCRINASRVIPCGGLDHIRARRHVSGARSSSGQEGAT